MSCLDENLKLTITGISAVIPIKPHRPVALVRAVHVQRPVARELLVVRAHAVARRIRVGEHARVQHDVGARADARHHRARAERRLLDLFEVVGRVAVQGEPTDRSERVVLVRPHPRDVEDVPPVGLGLLGVHDL